MNMIILFLVLFSQTCFGADSGLDDWSLRDTGVWIDNKALAVYVPKGKEVDLSKAVLDKDVRRDLRALLVLAPKSIREGNLMKFDAFTDHWDEKVESNVRKDTSRFACGEKK